MIRYMIDDFGSTSSLSMLPISQPQLQKIQSKSPRAHPLPLPHPLNTPQPRNPALDKLLRHRLQFLSLQRQIIDSPNSTKTQTGKAAAAPVHQRSASFAEGASHGVACADRSGGGVGGEVVETADVGQGGGFDCDLLGC